MVTAPVVVLKTPVPREKSIAPVPAVIAMPLSAAKVVAPLMATAPVPVVNVLLPEITTLPPKVFVPVEVRKVPEPAEKSKFPAPVV
jgi:hypothetical protein